MSLFSIETAPVPLDAETYIGDKREYTQIIPQTEYIALTDNNYVPLTHAQISLCAKIGHMSCLSKTTCFLANYTPHSLQAGRKWVSFFERSGLLGTKSGLKPRAWASANQRPSRH